MAAAGYTTVTGQVIDRNGQIYVNANFGVTFVNQNHVPGAPEPKLGGGLFPPQRGGNQCDSDGFFSIELPDNNLITPAPSQWLFTFCSRWYLNPRTRYCFTWQGTITGTTLDLTAILQAIAPLLPTAGTGIGQAALSSITPAIASNAIQNLSYPQAWIWSLTGTTPMDAIYFGEQAGNPSTNTGAGSAIVGIGTAAGSTVDPLRAVIGPVGRGLQVDALGNVNAVQGAILIGPVRIPAILDARFLGTDLFGNVIPSTAPAGLQSINSDTTAAQQIVAGTGIVVTNLAGGVTVISLAPPNAPTVTNVSPATGPTNGGQSVSISGTNFAPGATVMFGGHPATNVVVVSSTLITAVTPADIPGTVTVSVTVGANTGSLPNAYTYVAAVEGIYGGPSLDATGGATTVTQLTGTTATLSDSTVINLLQTTPETVGDDLGPFVVSNQFVYLLLFGASRRFIDQNGFNFVFNAPIPVTVPGQVGITMYLYQSTNSLFGSYTVRISA